MSYLTTAEEVYRSAAETPDVGLCCTTTPIWSFPGLSIPQKMLDMNYGCGSTVHPRDLVNDPTILYEGEDIFITESTYFYDGGGCC